MENEPAMGLGSALNGPVGVEAIATPSRKMPTSRVQRALRLER